MNEYILIYLIEKLSTIQAIFIIFSIASAILMIAIFVVSGGKKCFFKENKKAKIPFYTFPILVFMSCLTPSTIQAYKIIGIGTIVRYINSDEKVKDLPDNLIQYVNIQLEEVIKEEQENETNNNR